jgi:hypothetical protein
LEAISFGLLTATHYSQLNYMGLYALPLIITDIQACVYATIAVLSFSTSTELYFRSMYFSKLSEKQTLR